MPLIIILLNFIRAELLFGSYFVPLVPLALIAQLSSLVFIL
jgi:hypothetical protein